MIVVFGELYSSKNSRIGIKVKGRNIVLKSPKAKAQEKAFALQLSALRSRFLAETKSKQFPLRVQFKMYRKTHGRFDFLNLAQGLCDGMVRAGLIPDDDAKHFIPSFLPYEKDSKNPRTEITVL